MAKDFVTIETSGTPAALEYTIPELSARRLRILALYIKTSNTVTTVTWEQGGLTTLVTLSGATINVVITERSHSGVFAGFVYDPSKINALEFSHTPGATSFLFLCEIPDVR